MGKVAFRYADIRRALSAVKECGFEVHRIEFDGSKVTLYLTNGSESPTLVSPLDDWLSKRARKTEGAG
jgi:hypothetical protein